MDFQRFIFRNSSQYIQPLFIKILSILSIVLLTAIAFYPALDNQFVSWDDQFYVSSNPLVLNPSVESFKALMTKVVSLNYHPLTMWTLWGNAKISGVESATPFILTNIILHLFNSILVFILALHLSRSKYLVALTTALFFAVHPMHVESVVWVSERKDVLYAFFFLLSLISYFHYINQEKKRRWFVASLLFFVMACLSKAMAVSLVPCLFLIDVICRRSLMTVKTMIEKIPFFVLALLTGLVAINVQSGGDFYGLLSPSEIRTAVNPDIDLSYRLNNAAFANYYYLKQFLWPTRHAAFHPYSLAYESRTVRYVGVSIVAIFYLVWSIFKRRPVMIFGLGFYFCTILLVLQWIPVGSAIVADRYTYLPYIGLSFLMGYVMDSFCERFRWIAIVGLSAIVLAMEISTSAQAEVWENHVSLFGQVVERYPEDAFARRSLATGYWTVGELDSALYHMRYAIEDLDLQTSSAYELLANCYADKGLDSLSLEYFNKAIVFDMNNVTARYHRGLQLLKENPSSAVADFNYCEQSSNSYVVSLVYAARGRAYGLLGQYDLALEDLSKAISLYPNDINAFLDRAITYERLGEWEEAAADYESVLRLDSEQPYASSRLALMDKVAK